MSASRLTCANFVAAPKAIGKIWRLAVSGLPGGTADTFRGRDSAHTTEAADRRAVVLVPDKFDTKGKDPVEVLLYFHGHTESWRGQYRGRGTTEQPLAVRSILSAAAAGEYSTKMWLLMRAELAPAWARR